MGRGLGIFRERFMGSEEWKDGHYYVQKENFVLFLFKLSQFCSHFIFCIRKSVYSYLWVREPHALSTH